MLNWCFPFLNQTKFNAFWAFCRHAEHEELYLQSQSMNSLMQSYSKEPRPQVYEPLSEMIDAILWQNHNIKNKLNLLQFINIRQLACDRSELNATDRGHKPTMMSLGIKKSPHVWNTLPQDQAGCSFIKTPSSQTHAFSCPHQFIQHLIEVYSAHSVAVYTIYASQ